MKITFAHRAGVYQVIVNVLLGNYIRHKTQVAAYDRRTLL